MTCTHHHFQRRSRSVNLLQPLLSAVLSWCCLPPILPTACIKEQFFLTSCKIAEKYRGAARDCMRAFLHESCTKAFPIFSPCRLLCVYVTYLHIYELGIYCSGATNTEVSIYACLCTIQKKKKKLNILACNFTFS